MKRFTVDPRDGGLGLLTCNTCCCTPLGMRPGETDKMVINYAPWSVPIGGIGLITGSTEIDISVDSAACSVATINGFAPPSLGVTTFETALNTTLVFDVTEFGAFPVGNTFTFSKVPFSGPSYGSLVADEDLDGNFTYVPQRGFVGYDQFYVDMKDAQGRNYIQKVVIAVGAPVAPYNDAGKGLIVDRTKIVVNPRMHTIEFPISLLPDARACETYTMNIKQSARDCSDLYSHLSCYTINVGKC